MTHTYVVICLIALIKIYTVRCDNSDKGPEYLFSEEGIEESSKMLAKVLQVLQTKGFQKFYDQHRQNKEKKINTYTWDKLKEIFGAAIISLQIPEFDDPNAREAYIRQHFDILVNEVDKLDNHVVFTGVKFSEESEKMLTETLQSK